jgi:hypothetical protein
MTFITPQDHINTTPREINSAQLKDVALACAIAITVMITAHAAHKFWSGPVQKNIAHQIETQ